MDRGSDPANAGALAFQVVEQPLAPDLDATRDTAGFAALRTSDAAWPDESCWDLEDLRAWLRWWMA